MLDPRLLRADINAVKQALSHRKLALDVDLYSALETQRKALQIQTQELQNDRNSRSKAIGQAKAKGEDIQPLLYDVQSLGDQLKEAENVLSKVQEELNAFFMSLPN
ncbi:MAG: serine--tRNA ligase, partial [Methylococcales bacterium]|nr:serine--tRNA ligase [Methylococcales bacterium]